MSEVAIRNVFEGLTSTFTDTMNENLSREITEEELGKVVTSMAKGKAPGHDGIPMELFKQLWHTIGQDFHQVFSQKD